MTALGIVDLIVSGVAGIATILATYFAWRAVHESKETVVLASETVEVAKAALEVEKENLASLKDTVRTGHEALQLAQENLETARGEQRLVEAHHYTERLSRLANAVVDFYMAATRIEALVVSAPLEFAAARARLRAGLVGLPMDLPKCRALPNQGSDPGGLGIIKNTWTTALFEIEEAIAQLTTAAK